MKIIGSTFSACLIFVLSLLLVSCGDNSVSTPKFSANDAAGTWTVTRTMVTQNPDFPNGYQDIQVWTIAVNGTNGTLTTPAGTISGSWKTSANFSTEHWVFEYIGPDPRTGFQIKVLVEIIGASPLKGTNDTYTYDSWNNLWLLGDSFRIEGVKQ